MTLSETTGPHLASIGAAAALSLGLAGLASAGEPDCQCSPPETTGGDCDLVTDRACVYRDRWGVPHIEAATEVDAWYALGYEEARDALYRVQVSLMIYAGRASEFFGDGAPQNGVVPAMNLSLDYMVQVLGLDLRKRIVGDGPVTQQHLDALKTVLRRHDHLAAMGEEDQFFENLQAYAKGLEDYRLRLFNGVGLNCQEVEYVAWLSHHTRKFALEEEIDVFRVASYGPWIKSGAAFAVAALSDIPFQTGPSLPTPPAASMASTTEAFVQNTLESRPGMGSNGMAWSNDYTREGAVGYTCVMGDPHAGISRYAYGELPNDVLSTVWYAHIVVDDPSSPEPRLDVFGQVHHGSGVFFIGHNENVGWGGSGSLLNLSDTFLLRLEKERDDPTQLADPVRYYDYYQPGFVDFPIGAPLTATIKRRDGADLSVRYWRLDGVGGQPGFGIVTDADQSTPELDPWYTPAESAYAGEDWAIGGDAANLILDAVPAGSPPAAWEPVIFANRAASDPSVDGYQAPDDARPHDRFAVGLYELMRAETVHDVKDLVAGLDLTFLVDFCAGDREGRVFATGAGMVPQRGDDASLASRTTADGYEMNSWSKWDVYEKAFDFEPVPARWASDIDFDYQFDGNGDLQYLVPDGAGIEAGTSNADLLPYVLFDPVEPAKHFPPQESLDDPPVFYENLGFVTASNDDVFNFYKKRWKYDPNIEDVGDQVPFDKLLKALDNDVFTEIQKAGTLYYNTAFEADAVDKNQRMIDIWLDIASGASPPMTTGEARLFVQGRDNYAPLDYPGYYDGSALQPPSGQEAYPTPIRNLTELGQNYLDIVTKADDEIAFLRDLWNVLHGSPHSWDGFDKGGGLGLVDLKSVWVDNDAPCFWYPAGAYEEFAMPNQLALIDFYWPEVRLGDTDLKTYEALGTRVVVDGPTLQTLIVDLQNWEPGPGYFNVATSEDAALLLQYQLGLAAGLNGIVEYGAPPTIDEYQEGRMWVPLFSGGTAPPFALASPARFPDPAGFVVVPIDAQGGLPDVDATDVFTAGPGAGLFLSNLLTDYTFLRSMVFPRDPWDSVMWEPAPPGFGPQPYIATLPDAPLDALYSDVSTRTVKTVAELTNADVTAIVQFFLDLGGFTVFTPPGGSAVCTKVAAYESWWANPLVKPLPYKPTYPLTRTMARVTLMKRLLEASEFMSGWPSKTFGDIMHARVIDPTGVQRWPLVEDTCDPDEVGVPVQGGAFRGYGPELEDGELLSDAFKRGFMDRLWALGGAYGPLLTMLPDDGSEPCSYWWVAPGQRADHFASPLFANVTETYVTGEMADSFYATYRTPGNWQDAFTPDVGLPRTPYAVNDPNP